MSWTALRPYHEEQAGNDVTSADNAANDFFFVKANGGLVKIFFEKILFIEALKEYVKIVTTERTVITYHTISGLQEKLPAGNFYRIHRSFIAAKDKIAAFTATDVEINNKSIPIGRSYKELVLSVLQNDY